MVTDAGKEGGVSVIHSSSIIEVSIVYFFTTVLSLGVLFELLNVIRGKNNNNNNCCDIYHYACAYRKLMGQFISFSK